jgi:hypothetical protein
VEKSKRDQVREFLRWTDALLRSMEVCLRGDDPKNVWKHAGYKPFARKYVQILLEVRKILALPPILDTFDLEKMPSFGDTIAIQQKSIFESVHANVSVLKSFLEGELGLVDDEVAGLRDFIEARLRSAIMREPERERDVQDSIEQLMIGRGLLKGLDYDREVGRVKVSSKEVVPDFVFPKLALALEVKLLTSASRLKEAIDEINADIAAYSKRYPVLLFVVYDLGCIRDVTEFRRDLEREAGTSVVVVKH